MSSHDRIILCIKLVLPTPLWPTTMIFNLPICFPLSVKGFRSVTDPSSSSPQEDCIAWLPVSSAMLPSSSLSRNDLGDPDRGVPGIPESGCGLIFNGDSRKIAETQHESSGGRGCLLSAYDSSPDCLVEPKAELIMIGTDLPTCLECFSKLYVPSERSGLGPSHYEGRRS
ncbi:hypothetical protein KC363_g89 [Hortaea werneckii]|nr:hypothetical protein KC363_g89 [Hortaea werneckii]